MNVESITRPKRFRAYSYRDMKMVYSNGDLIENAKLFAYVATHPPGMIVVMDNVGFKTSETGIWVHEFDICECHIVTDYGIVKTSGVVTFDIHRAKWDLKHNTGISKSVRKMLIVKVLGNAIEHPNMLKDTFHIL